VQLDVTDDASVAAALATIDSAEGRLDVLVNNAGILGAGVVDGPMALRVFDTNAVGVVRVTEVALSLLRRSENPRWSPFSTPSPSRVSSSTRSSP
jgi:NAD(P)-dependent dehydrogenase (short-subunit alcohol dehydrogenase family)